MSNKRFTSLIQIIILTLGSIVAIAQPMRSQAISQYSSRVEETVQISFLKFIFPKRKVRNRGSRNSSRAPFNVSLPHALSPRNTALIPNTAVIENGLTLRWNPVIGASSYIVEINGRNVDWEVQVAGTEAIYDELESLNPDYRYTIVVTTDKGVSSESGEPVGFTLLSESESDRVNMQIEVIQAEQLEPDEEAIAIALEYFEFEHSDRDRRSYSLNQAAIDVLENRIQADTEDSRVYLLQADIYLKIGLPLLAQERYKEALNYAEITEQQELQAESHWGLADVAKGQTDYEEALVHLQMAQGLYVELGDQDQSEELQSQIKELETQLP